MKLSPRLLILLPLFALIGCGSDPEPNADTKPISSTVSHQHSQLIATDPLKIGDRLPELKAEGWLNGPPPKIGPGGPRLVLVDLWAHWCPYCDTFAPELAKVHNNFFGKDIVFVSITNHELQRVSSHVKNSKMTWPCGYGASDELLIALGATSGMPTPGYELAPTMYLLGPDGKIIWTDQRSRFRHQSTRQLAKDLENAIDEALKATATSK